MFLFIMFFSCIIAIFPHIALGKAMPFQQKRMILKKNKKTTIHKDKRTLNFTHDNLMQRINSITKSIAECHETKKFHTDMLFDGLAQVSDLIGDHQRKEKKRMFFSLMSLIFKLVAQMTKRETRSIQSYDLEIQTILDQIVKIMKDAYLHEK